MSDINNPALGEEKVGIGAYISLFLAILFFSGVMTGNHWWAVLDFTSLSGGWGKVVGAVKEVNDHVSTTMSNFRGRGGSGAIDGFALALTLVPSVMFAIAMITVFEYYGALRAARKLLTPLMQPLLGLPGSCTLALITSLSTTDGGAALTRQLKDSGEINEDQTAVFCQFQYTADATIANFLTSGAVLLTLTTADGKMAVPTTVGVALGVALVMKVLIANVLRLLLKMKSKKSA